METNVETQTVSPQETGASVPEVGHGFTSVEPWDYKRSSGRLASKSAQLVQFYQALARGLGRSLSVFLSTTIEVEVAEAKETIYEDFVTPLPTDGFFAAIRTEPQPSALVMHMDAGVISPILDLLLGGTAETPCARPELSDVDTTVLTEASRVIVRELEIVWHATGMKLRPEVIVGKPARMQLGNFLPVLVLTMNFKLAGSTGVLSLVHTSPIIDAIMHAIELRPEESTQADISLARTRAENMLQIPVSAELVLPPVRVPIRSLSALAPNTVLSLPLSADEPATLAIAGIGVFRAMPARLASARAAKLEQKILKASQNFNETSL